MTWLVTGGAGFIGSHVVQTMTQAGERVCVVDDLSTGNKNRLADGVDFEQTSVRDRSALDSIIRDYQITGIIHIAGKKQVPESVQRPLWYYQENLNGLRTLLEAAAEGGVKRFIFSSSAAVYGNPADPRGFVSEDSLCAPESPYAQTKLVGEWLVRATAQAHDLSYIVLRYFNVAGCASPQMSDVGLFNLVAKVFESLEREEAPLIFGGDYSTPDGTTIRDYIHVSDIADAHLAAVKRLKDKDQTALTLNVGRGQGTSTREMITEILRISRVEIEPVVRERRPGDLAVSIAVADRIKAELGWSAQYNITDMISSAWAGWRYHHDVLTRG